MKPDTVDNVTPIDAGEPTPRRTPGPVRLDTVFTPRDIRGYMVALKELADTGATSHPGNTDIMFALVALAASSPVLFSIAPSHVGPAVERWSEYGAESYARGAEAAAEVLTNPLLDSFGSATLTEPEEA